MDYYYIVCVFQPKIKKKYSTESNSCCPWVKTPMTFKSDLRYLELYLCLELLHCMKSVRIRSYSVSLHIQSKCGKMRTSITSKMDIFYAMLEYLCHLGYKLRLFLGGPISFQKLRLPEIRFFCENNKS